VRRILEKVQKMIAENKRGDYSHVSNISDSDNEEGGTETVVESQRSPRSKGRGSK
jgi:hypothetical protein